MVLKGRELYLFKDQNVTYRLDLGVSGKTILSSGNTENNKLVTALKINSHHLVTIQRSGSTWAFAQCN